jgi:diguanylate cyclase (GGDEF)-like protein/PAS domain S-box-containing protein
MGKDRGGANRGNATDEWQDAEGAADLRDDTSASPDESAHWLIFQTVPLGLFEASVTGQITRFNPAAVSLFTGSLPGALEVKDLSALFVDPEEWETLAADLTRTGLVQGREVLLKRQGDTEFWAQLDLRVVLPANGRALLSGAVQDITARKHREDRLRQTATHDPLTGLPHRAALIERIKKELARMRRDLNHRFAVGFIDLDNFKAVNDHHGHMVGDQVLLAVAHRLKRGLRPEDTVYRYGGDEFAVVLQDVGDTESADIVGRRMLDVLQAPLKIQADVVAVTASVGIRLCQSHDQNPDELLNSADRAMYESKSRAAGARVAVVGG